MLLWPKHQRKRKKKKEESTWKERSKHEKGSNGIPKLVKEETKMEVNVVKILNWESEFSGNSRSGICKFSCALVGIWAIYPNIHSMLPGHQEQFWSLCLWSHLDEFTLCIFFSIKMYLLRFQGKGKRKKGKRVWLLWRMVFYLPSSLPQPGHHTQQMAEKQIPDSGLGDLCRRWPCHAHSNGDDVRMFNKTGRNGSQKPLEP